MVYLFPSSINLPHCIILFSSICTAGTESGLAHPCGVDSMAVFEQAVPHMTLNVRMLWPFCLHRHRLVESNTSSCKCGNGSSSKS